MWGKICKWGGVSKGAMLPRGRWRGNLACRSQCRPHALRGLSEQLLLVAHLAPCCFTCWTVSSGQAAGEMLQCSFSSVLSEPRRHLSANMARWCSVTTVQLYTAALRGTLKLIN